jgi:hypothetical protein
MGRKDWEYIHLPKLLVKRLDEFLQTPKARSMGMTSKSELLRLLINQYLDEQEALYNNMESISEFVMQIKEKDHLVLTYNEESQLRELLQAFVEKGIKSNQISILNIFRDEEPLFTQLLQKSGLDVDTLFNSNDIILIPSDDCFYKGKFSVEPFVKSLDAARDLARRKGKSGLNIICTTPGKLVREGRYEDAITDERATHELIQKYDIPVTVLCLYMSIPKAVEERLLECHDLIIKRAVTEEQTGLL